MIYREVARRQPGAPFMARSDMGGVSFVVANDRLSPNRPHNSPWAVPGAPFMARSDMGGVWFAAQQRMIVTDHTNSPFPTSNQPVLFKGTASAVPYTPAIEPCL